MAERSTARTARRGLLAAALAAVLPSVVGAQAVQPWPPSWKWTVSATAGFYLGTAATWEAIDAGLQGSSWSASISGCGILTCSRPSDNVSRASIAPGLAVRRDFGERFGLRAAVVWARPGRYPVSSGSYRADVRPSVAVLAVQGVATAGPVWIAAGPSLNAGRIEVAAPAGTSIGSATNPGLSFAVGLRLPKAQKLVLDASLARHVAGSVTIPATPVPGAAGPLPALSVPLSVTVVSVGVGWRF